ncbi:MAG TPA: class I SAM-dependent methyltransferase [Pseudoxanthomonas sp.]|nr:class I SAM-dependent methyltransferase [Pseudoxanthomonas sp.]
MTNIPDKSPQGHWQSVYRTKPADSVSWFRPRLDVSLKLLRQAGLNASSRLLDVGGGASTLVDDLLDAGLRDITVLDLSSQALETARQRIGPKAEGVQWLVGDLLLAEFPKGRFDLWHDRAVLHFLDNDAARLYAQRAAHAIAVGGHAVIGCFALDGPERCSGLPVTRRSARNIAELMAPAFRLVAEESEQHLTPGKTAQAFVYALLQRD